MLSKMAMKVTRLGKINSLLRPYTAWSQSLSFSSPEADFCCSATDHELESSVPSWTNSLSFASPESDFTAIATVTSKEIIESEDWSGMLSFASPEADFSAEPDAADWEWSNQLSFASPEADFQAAALPTDTHAVGHEFAPPLQHSPIMALAISSPESALGFLHAHQLLNRQELRKLHQVREEHQGELPLPVTMQEAIAGDDKRAIVITELQAPFRIVDVNKAWVDLCGYSKEEVRNHSLHMIQGPDTSKIDIDNMLKRLLDGQETSALLTNYTKMGRKFYNRVRAGPLFNENQTITHFVGILEEVREQPGYFQVAHV